MNETDVFEQDLISRIEQRKGTGLYRSLVHHDGLIDFCSNDYLGFAKNKDLYISYDIHLSNGSTGSRLISGNSEWAEETERLIASHHHADAALIFNTGYMANVGLLSSLAKKDDTYIYDEYAHASMIDGMRLSMAKRYKFQHNDINDLENKLKAASGKKYIIVESVYSMDGDFAPLQQIVELGKKYDAAIIVDEAHAVGMFGENGSGRACELGIQNDIFARVVTFGKALGLHGAAVLGSSILRDYLINFARSFIYTTALPSHSYIQIQQVYKLLQHAEQRNQLFELIRFFKKSIQELSNINYIESNTAIQALIIGDQYKAVELSNALKNAGFYAKAILSPTVPEGTERLRICLHSYNTQEEITSLLYHIQIFLS